MKESIDLNSNKIKNVIEYYEIKWKTALKFAEKIEYAVLPIYFPIKKVHRPEQIGSGVIVKIGTEYFIFSASHVFDVIGSHR